MKITYANKETLVVNPVPEINKVSAGDMNEIKASVNYLYDVNGWAEFKDTQNSQSVPQVFLPNTPQPITINAGSTIVNQKPLGGDLWSNDKINPIKVGDAYLVRIDFEASITNADGFFDLGLFVGGSVGFAFENTFRFPKGNNVPHKFSFSQLVYTLDTFVANGGELMVTSSHQMSVWNKRIIISKVHDGR